MIADTVTVVSILKSNKVSATCTKADKGLSIPQEYYKNSGHEST